MTTLQMHDWNGNTDCACVLLFEEGQKNRNHLRPPDLFWINCFLSGLIHHVIDFQCFTVGKYPHWAVLPEIGKSFEYRCSQLSPGHRMPLPVRRQLQVDYVATDRSCNSFVRLRYLHLNAYCRHLKSIKTDCKLWLLGTCKKIKNCNKGDWHGN
jgi:hypothetical protein